jgi:hypothetical protein
VILLPISFVNFSGSLSIATGNAFVKTSTLNDRVDVGRKGPCPITSLRLPLPNIMAYPPDPIEYCSDDVEPNRFWRRGWHGSAIYNTSSGPALIIDGGELLVLKNGTPNGVVANSTYTISLSRSWRPKAVEIKCLPRTDGAVWNKPNLWSSFGENNTVYSFNGGRSMSYPREELSNDLPIRPVMWSFTDTSWASAGTPPIEGSTEVALTQGHGIAYFLGGFQSWFTSRQIYEDHGKDYMAPSAGLITFQNQMWFNLSIHDYIPSGWLWSANMEHVPMFAANGLIIAMGGLTAYNTDPNAPNFLPYSFVGIYNPATDQWRNQTTYGSIPKSRRRACTVGIPGDNGTYEVRERARL